MRLSNHWRFCPSDVYRTKRKRDLLDLLALEKFEKSDSFQRHG